MAEFRVINENPGIKTHGNPISLPSGSLLTGVNFEVTRDNVYTKCRGRASYGTDLPSQNVLQLMQYKNRVFPHMGNNTIYYDSDGAGVFSQVLDVSGTNTFAQPDSTTLIQYAELVGNLYFATSTGVKKLDALGGTTKNAGVPKGLSFDLRVVDITGNWLPTDSAVAYRVLWSYYDANSNKIIGAPSERQDIGQASGSDRAVNLRIYIPSGITTAYTYEVYRTSTVTPATTIPSEDFQLVYQSSPSSAQITAGVVDFNDILPAGFRGAALYTNTSQKGIQKAYEMPPLCKTLTPYKNYMFYGNTESVQRLYSALISASGLTAATSTITINDGTNTKTIGVVTEIAEQAVTSCADNGSGLVRVTKVGHGYSTGDYVRIEDIVGTTEANGVWEITKIDNDNFDLIGSAFAHAYTSGGTIIQYEDIGATPRFIKFTTGTPAQNIDKTARSIVKTINLMSGTKWLAYYMSNYSEAPGKFLITGKTVGQTAFYLICDLSSTGTNFSPVLPTSGTAYISTNDKFKNGLMYSEQNNPEGVPTANIIFIGSADDDILKVVGLKDSLFIIKSKDGLLRLTGETESSFYVTTFDDTVKVYQKNSIAKGQNSIFAFSTLGYVSITDSGVEVVGRDIEKDTLKPIYNANFATKGYGWFNENEKTYFCSTYLDQDSTANDIVWTWNNFTRSWTQRKYGVYTNDTNISCAIVVSDLTYSAPLTGNKLLKERKAYAVADYSTPDVSVTISSINSTTNTIELSAAIIIPDESLLYQGTTTRTILNIDTTGKILTMNSVENYAAGAATVIPGIVSSVKYQACHANYPEYEKDFQKLIIYFDNDETLIRNVTVKTYSDLSATAISTEANPNPTNPWGIIPWGSVWGSKDITDKILTLVPTPSSRGSKIYIELEHSRPRERIDVCGYSVVFDLIDTRTVISS